MGLRLLRLPLPLQLLRLGNLGEGNLLAALELLGLTLL